MVTFNFDGSRAVVAGIDLANEMLVRRAQFVVRQNTEAVRNRALQLVPRDTSRLANSIATAYEDDGLTGIVGTNLFYAPYVHFGTGQFATGGNGRATPWVYFSAKLNRFVTTKGTRPQPFLLPAFNEIVPQFERSMQRMLREFGS